MTSALLCPMGCAKARGFQVSTETTRFPREKPPPKRSAIFDGSVVRLRGARGETLGVEVRLSNEPKTPVRLSLPEILRVAAFSVGSLEVRSPSTDMYGPSTGRGTYPDVLVPRSGAIVTDDLAYFDVEIPGETEPGRYEGTLTIGERTIPVVIEVSRARIDVKGHPLVWVFYAPRDIARAHGFPDGDGPELVAKEGEYDALFRAHGAYLASDVSPSRFEARRAFVHDVKYWPVAIDTTSDDTIAADVSRWLAAFEGTGVVPFAIPVDEPHTDSERARARHIGEVIGRAGGGRPRLLRAVTDEARESYGDSIDVFISPKSIPEKDPVHFAPGVRFWTYNGKPPEAGSMILDTDGAGLRTWGWIAARYDVELWYAWEGLYFSDRYNHRGPTDVMHEPITFDERAKGGADFGNGDGVLAYPGPLPSLRLKELRRGLEDRLLLLELERCGGHERARDVERNVVPEALGEAPRVSTWPEGEIAWESARGVVLDALDRMEATCESR